MNTMMTIFLIAAIGYLLGKINIKGFSLGTSSILLVALIFGHFGMVLPAIIREFGLILFVTSVGFIAGPVFFENFKGKAFSYIFIGFFVIAIGSLMTFLTIKVIGIPKSLAIGMMSGALTSTPGLATALESTGDATASIGYGIAYPFGVIGVVLFVQALPKLIHANIDEEVKKIAPKNELSKDDSHIKKLLHLDDFGLFPFSVAVVLGVLLGMVRIPLPGGVCFSLGNSGGPLIAGLVLGHFKKVGNISLKIEEQTLDFIRELGLAIFLMGAGTTAGQGFIEILCKHGVKLFFIGVAMTVLPMILSYILAKYVLKLELFNNLGAICGGMTSTPALGSLISTAKTSNVAAAYAATYPIALICIVLASQILSIFIN